MRNSDAAWPQRRATPRPDFDAPRIVRRDETAHHVWGDAETGFVTDRVYLSTQQLHVLEYELPPGGEFRHSPMNQTIFGGDVLYFVLGGTLALADPSTGELRRARTDTGLLFRRGTWHHGFNLGPESLRVLEFFSPPPARGTASEFARRQPPLETSSYHDRRWERRWPQARQEADSAARLHLVEDDTALWSFRDRQPSHSLATLVDTEFLTVRHGLVLPGHAEEFSEVSEESMIVCTVGELWVDVLSPDGSYLPSCLTAGAAAYLPIGCRERVLVRSAAPARYLRGSGRVPDGWVV